MANFTEDDLTELDLLRSLEIDEQVSSGLISEHLRFDNTQLSELQFHYPEMILQIHTGPTYPAEQLSFGMENLTLPRLPFDALRTQLRKIASDDTAANNHQIWCAREDGDAFDCKMTALHLVQKTVEVLHHIRHPYTSDVLKNQVSSGKYKNDLIPNSGIVNKNATLNDIAWEVLGKTPEQVCNQLPSNFRVLHVENVVRHDSYRDLIKCKDRIRDRIYKDVSETELKQRVARHAGFRFPSGQRTEKADMVEHLITPKLTFHGTSNHLVPSIVRYGFLRDGDLNPESGMTLQARCGTTYGRGVYSSPSADFSLSYSGESAAPTHPNGFCGLKLIVCATIMGVPREMFRSDNWRTQNIPYAGADSHVANNDLEYIVFDTAQILPVYAIHLDWGEDNRKYFQDIPEDPANWVAKMHPKLQKQILAPGDKQRLKEALVAKAAK